MSHGDIDRLRNELEDLFNEVWRGPRFSRGRCFRPAIDSFRTFEPAELVVLVELAGVDPESVRVNAADRLLLISGERRRPRAPHGEHAYQQMEIDYGPFERRVVLGDDVETENGSATYERGLLRIVFPIVEQPSRVGPIPIKVRRGG